MRYVNVHYGTEMHDFNHRDKFNDKCSLFSQIIKVTDLLENKRKTNDKTITHNLIKSGTLWVVKKTCFWKKSSFSRQASLFLLGLNPQKSLV